MFLTYYRASFEILFQIYLKQLYLTAFALPKEWDSMNNQDYIKVKLNEKSEEYISVLKKFTDKGLIFSEIVQVSNSGLTVFNKKLRTEL